MIPLLSRLLDGSEFELTGHASLHRLALERRRAKVDAARQQIAEAWKEYRATMRQNRETVDYDWRTP